MVHIPKFSHIPYSGYFLGVYISWMLGIVVVGGKKIVVGSCLNHTPSTRIYLEQWPLVSKLWYEFTTSVKRSGMHKLATTPC